MTKLYRFTLLLLISTQLTLQAQEKRDFTANNRPDIFNKSLSKINAESAAHDTAYCYITFDQPNNRSGPAKFALSNPEVIILLADQSSMNYVSSGTWGSNNKWFGTVSTENNLITINPITGERVLLGNTTIAFLGITYDYTFKTLFGVAWDGFASNLYSISKIDGAITLIGQSTNDILINLACDASGKLYSVGIIEDVLYEINKSGGSATLVGSIGIDANYEQDMEFDLNTGILYMAAYNSNTSSGEFRTIDPATGFSTLIGTFQGGAEITGLCIPNNTIEVGIEEPYSSEIPAMLFPNPGNGIFTLQTELEEPMLEIYNILGKQVYSAQIISSEAIVDISMNSKGIYFYEIKSGNKIKAGKIIIE